MTLLFTSGTTGRPKGVMVTAGNAAATARNYSLSARVDAGSVFLCDMPMFHVVGLFAVTNTILQVGGTLLISSQFAAGETLERLADPTLAVTHYFCVPQMAKQLREHAAFDAAPLSPPHGDADGRRTAFRRGCADVGRRRRSFVDGYGMTEVGTALGMPPDDLDVLRRKAGSVGLPAVSIDVRLVDRAGREVGADDAGEIWLRVRRSRRVIGRIPRHPAMRSRTVGSAPAMWRGANADGFFTLMDRWKDMFISGGENVYPAEVEAVLRELPGVEDVAVIGVADPRWGEVGAAYVVLAPGRNSRWKKCRPDAACGSRDTRFPNICVSWMPCRALPWAR